MPKGIYQRGVIHRKPHSLETKTKIGLANKEKVRSDEMRQHMSKVKSGQKYPNRKRYPKGELHFNWKGGRTSKNQLIRTSLEYKLWRKAVFERDNYTCVWCGARCGKGREVILNADHIKPFAYFPELRFAIDNGRTLCRECHKTTDTYAGKCKKLTKL